MADQQQQRQPTRYSVVFGEVEQRTGSGALKRPYWAYNILVKVKRDGEQPKDYKCTHRYSDFEWFRKRLSQLYPACIIPPIPEKDINGTVEKFVQSSHNPGLIEYRKRALRRFLVRVGAHPMLGESDELSKFIEMGEEDWAAHMKATADQPISVGLSRIANTASDAWNPAAGPTPGNQSYTTVVSSGALPVDDPYRMWEETGQYVGQLEESVKTLRDRLDSLGRRRKGTGTALNDFGNHFVSIGQIEGQLDASNDNGLTRASTAVGRHAQSLAQVYQGHAKDEAESVVESLQYYIGACSAVREALQRLKQTMNERESLRKTREKAQANAKKQVDSNAPTDKVQKANDELKDVDARLQAAARHVDTFERNFREELRRFHREKQYDMKEILRRFVQLQRDYTEKMKRSWDDLATTVEDVRVA